MTHGPIGALIQAGTKDLAYAPVSADGMIPGVYTLGEMFQVVALLRGESNLPSEVRRLCGIAPSFTPLSNSSWLDCVDLLLIEPASPDELMFRGAHLNRAQIINLVYDPVKSISSEAARLVYNWYQRGLVERNAETQAACADQIIAKLPSDFGDRRLIADVLRELRVESSDVESGIRRLRDEIGRPIGVITYTFAFMPDGRPVHMPPNFVKTVVASATELGIPIMEPWRLVQAHGIDAALRGDLRHYSDPFLPVVGHALVSFAREVLSTAASRVGDLSTAATSAGRTESTEELSCSLEAISHSAPVPKIVPPITRYPDRAAEARDPHAVTGRVNALLLELHRTRVAELGVNESGLYQHYKGLLDASRIADARLASIAGLIADGLPEFGSYHVLRAGLGELAFVLAALGLPVLACESNLRRSEALSAGFGALSKVIPQIGENLVFHQVAIPQTVPDRALCVAKELIGYNKDQERETLTVLSQYDALLVSPRLFLWQRESLAEQRAAIDAIVELGFTTIREFTEFQLVLCAKPHLEPKRSVVLQDDFPEITSIINTFKAIPIDQTGRHNVPEMTVGVRDFPFPYASALAVSTGVTWESRTHFQQIREFVCGRRETPYGTGLGLEIGGAFTLSRKGSIQAAFGTNSVRTDPDDEADLIELARSGWIDTIREVVMDDLARQALSRLEEAGVAPMVGIDMDGQWHSVQYMSGGSLLESEKFGDHLDYGASSHWLAAVKSYAWEQWRELMPAASDVLAARFNSTLQPRAHGDDVSQFKRFRGEMKGTWSSFPSQVTSQRLNALERRRGAVVVDVEAATWSLIGARSGNDNVRPLGQDEVFDHHAIECWRDIAARSHERRLLVATVSRLLHWLSRRSSTLIETKRAADKWVVDLSLQQGSNDHSTLQLLDGLAITVPADAPEIVVTVSGQVAVQPFRREADPSSPGRHAVYRPWSPLAWS